MLQGPILSEREERRSTIFTEVFIRSFGFESIEEQEAFICDTFVERMNSELEFNRDDETYLEQRLECLRKSKEEDWTIDDDELDSYEVSEIKTEVKTICAWCGKIIAKGTEAVRMNGKDGSFVLHKECPR